MTEYSHIQHDPNPQQYSLPNAVAVLVLGIIGIITCCCYGGGAILSIIALVLASKDMKLYKANPEKYTTSSFNNLNTGRICAIIALVFSVSYLILMALLVGAVGWEALSNPEAMQEALESL